MGQNSKEPLNEQEGRGIFEEGHRFILPAEHIEHLLVKDRSVPDRSKQRAGRGLKIDAAIN
jgi:hypothetical protein